MSDQYHPLLKRRPAINPYLIGGHEILQRLQWDIRPQSWRSRHRLQAMRDIHKGRKAVILCNGPSLNRVDFDLLKGTYCFGLNKIHLLFSRSDFRPSCIVAANLYVIEQTAAFYRETDIPLFLSSKGMKFIGGSRNRIFFHPTGLNRRFARDCSMSLFGGNTVTYVAMQLAYHMGFSEVALVGCDHHFDSTGPAAQVAQGGDSDPNHFDPSYFANVLWELPDLLGSEMSYRLALDVYRAGGRSLVNATDGGRLEILPRMALADFLARP